MFNARAAQAYAQIGLETGVAAASPHRLVVMLYDGALKAVAEAGAHLAAGRVAEKGAAVSRAISIVEQGLKASLDTSRGGSIATSLAELYDYMGRRLLLASMRNDASMLKEVAGLLRELSDAWSAIDQPLPAATADLRYATA